MANQYRSRRRMARLLRHLATATLSASMSTPFIATSVVAQERSTLTLDAAIHKAVLVDPGLRAAGAGVDAARGTVRQARVWNNPQLSTEVENFSGRGALSGFKSAETTFSVSQELDLSGQRRARIGLANRELRGAELDRVIRGLDLVRDVQTAYYDALSSQDLVAIAEERLATANSLNASVSRRVAAARDPLMAGARAEAGLSEARIALTRAQSEAATARARLASFFGGDDGFNLASADFDLQRAEAHAHDAPSDAMPDVAKLVSARDRAGAVVKVERSLAWSNPSVSLGYRRFEEQNGEGALVAGVTIPFGVFDRNQGNVARARADEQRADYELQAGRLALAREFAALQRAISTEERAILSVEEDVIPKAERALKLAQDGYNRGAFSYLDVLDAQRALSDARQARVEALRSYHNNEAAIDRLTARFAEALPLEEKKP